MRGRIKGIRGWILFSCLQYVIKFIWDWEWGTGTGCTAFNRPRHAHSAGRVMQPPDPQGIPGGGAEVNVCDLCVKKLENNIKSHFGFLRGV